MHHPNRWPVVLGPGGTQNIAKLRIMEKVDELERSWIQFDGRMRSYHVRMRELFANFSKNSAVPSPHAVQKVGKKTGNKLNEVKSIEKMGEAIEKALMHEETTKINKVQEIKKALERAFAEGRSKEKGNNIKTVVAIKESEKLPQAKQPINSKTNNSNRAMETRVSQVAPKITEDDNYSVRSIELDDLEQLPVKEIPKQQQEQSKSSAVKYPLLKRRYQAYEKSQKSTPPKRVKSPQSPVKSDAKPNSKNIRYVNPMSVCKYGKIAKKSFRPSQATYKTATSVSLSSDYQSNRNAPSASVLAKTQANHIEPTMAPPTKGAMKQYGPSTTPLTKQMRNHNGQTTSVLAAQQSKPSDADSISDTEMVEDLHTGSSASVLPKKRSKQSDADDILDISDVVTKDEDVLRKIKHKQSNADDILNSEEDDDLPTGCNPAIELEMKREMQDAITNPSMAKLKGDGVMLSMMSPGSIAENAKIVYKALLKRKMSKSIEHTPLAYDGDDNDFGDILFMDVE